MDPLLSIHILTTVFLAGFALFVLSRRPPEPLWPVLFWAQISAATWVVGDLLAVLSPDLFWKQASLLVLYAGSLSVGPVWWLMALRYSEAQGSDPFARWPRVHRGRRLRRWLEWGPMWVAGGLWLLLATNPLHGQFLEAVLGGPQERFWMWYAAAVVGQAMGIATLTVYTRLFLRTVHRVRRRQAAVMLCAALTPVLVHIVWSFWQPPWPLELNVIGGAITALLFWVGVYRLDLFALSPGTLRELLAADDRAVVVVGPDGDLRFANDAAKRLLAVPRSTGLSLPVTLALALAPPDRPGGHLKAEALWEAMQELATEGGARLYRLWGSGDRYVLVTAVKASGRRGRASAYCLRLEDATSLLDIQRAREELESRLARALRLEGLGVFAGGVAHELNNPLGAARIQAEFARHLAQELQGDEGDRRALLLALEDITREVDRATKIVTGVLRFARTGHGDRQVNDVNVALLRSRSRTASLAAGQHGRVELALTDEEVLVDSDGVELEQLFSNLIENALQSRSGVHVIVESAVLADEVRVRVRDDGPGIPEPHGDRIFEPFFTTRRESGGTGLGLAIVHGIVKDHGGQIDVASEPGRGTEVLVRLPRAKEALA